MNSPSPRFITTLTPQLFQEKRCIHHHLIVIMPVHPSEEEAPSGIFDQIAKNPSSATESTASDHSLHQDEHSGGGKATPQDFQSKGPAVPQNMNGQCNLAARPRSLH